MYNDNREIEIQLLCDAVKAHFYHWEQAHHCSSSPDCFVCNFCDSAVTDNKSPLDIVHLPDCAYLIAKDLSTNKTIT